jgi:hypothetical protein
MAWFLNCDVLGSMYRAILVEEMTEVGLFGVCWRRFCLAFNGVNVRQLCWLVRAKRSGRSSLPLLWRLLAPRVRKFGRK